MEHYKTNEKGLLEFSDDCIYIQKDSFDFRWNVFKTRENSNLATQIFTFQTKEQAISAGSKIADAIGGRFYNETDPRK